MAVSLPPLPNTWNRTLPNPATLPPNGIDRRRSSSLLQHHISSDHFLAPAADEIGRQNTVPSLPRMQQERDSVAEDDYGRLRQDSVMSGQSGSESSSDSSSRLENTSDLCSCVPEPKIPRPRNAFILYRQHQHVRVVAQNPGLPNPDISKIIGEQWRQLSPKEKAEWQALAEQEKARHSQQFPDYRYRPRRSVKYQSGENIAAANQPVSCRKCGGKTMNPSLPPHHASFDSYHPPFVSVARPAKRAYTEAPVLLPRAPPSAQIAPHPHPTPLRYAFGSPHPPKQDSIHYIRGHPPPPPPPLYVALEGPEAKRRRMDPVHGPRPSQDHTYYERERAAARHSDQTTRHTMPPPARSSHPPPPPLDTPTRASQSGQPRRDPSLILPPLKTTVPPGNQSRKSGVESMILSYPVLTKLKTLHSITPSIAAPGPGSGTRQTRGAVIAVEGLDKNRVLDMTASLAEQLEKEGKYLIRTFIGPDPYQALHSSRRASIGQGGELMSVEKYLHTISAWHQVSKEIIEFVTRKTGPVAETPDRETADGSASAEPKQKITFERSPTQKSPISAVSPKTQSWNPMNTDDPATAEEGDDDGGTVRVTRSRVPQTRQGNERKQSDVPPPPFDRGELFPAASDKESSARHGSSGLMPVALVPHYQLTTVDSCSIALPITDNYDPLTHWRWHATLWRGCVGPDINVVIKSAHEQHEADVVAEAKTASAPEGQHRRAGSVTAPARPTDTAPSGSPPSSAVRLPVSAPAPFGVEVRLQDHRAVIVRTGNSGRAGTASEGNADRELEQENENWEKAKRRVGFEVEESLRR